MVWGLGCRVWGLGFRVWGLGLPGAPILARTDRYSSQFKNNYVAEMCSGSQAGSYLRLIDSCITQLNAQGPSRTCDVSKGLGLPGAPILAQATLHLVEGSGFRV